MPTQNLYSTSSQLVPHSNVIKNVSEWIYVTLNQDNYGYLLFSFSLNG